MATQIENIKVTDNHGFYYEVRLEHCPRHGFTSALYRGTVIAQVNLNKLSEPWGDNDTEWERYEQLLGEWVDEIKVNIIPMCRDYFNRKK